MSIPHEGGQGIPEIEREEHQHNLQAKRTVILDGSGNQITNFNDSTAYATRIDEASATVTYIGDAAIGSTAAQSVWRIKKIDSSSGTIITFADGNGNFDNVWNDRASLSYS